MERRVEEHYYWTSSAPGRTTEVVYRVYNDGIDGEQFFQSLIAFCIAYFVACLFLNSLVVFMIMGLVVVLIMQLFENVSPSTSNYHRSYF
uniref:Uncharacterized protein n=1 Tax=Physcomitrium patens TaxID=3218 RepID=A0A2K1JCS7_PHYPA|nr:hypothetical protein PHYPA_019614 [Physcomitrium patens]